MAGVSTPLLVVALAVVIITIIAIVWIKRQKSTKGVHNHDTEQQGGSYATLTRREHADITSNHPMDVLYAVIDMNKQGEEGQTMQGEQIVENPPNSEEKKREIALEEMYAVVNKQQKKQQTIPVYSTTVNSLHYNSVKMECAVEYEEVAPQIPPHTVEKLYTAVVKKPNGSTTPTERTPP